MPHSRPTTAVVLAAGPGTKFWPYSTIRQKAAFPIANVPAIRRTVDLLVELEFTRIVVVVGHGAASVRAALRGAAAQLSYVQQPQPLGTADAVLRAAAQLDDNFLVVFGDVVTAKENLALLCERFAQEQPIAAALIQPLGKEAPQEWLVAHAQGDQLQGVAGHPREGQDRLGGIYAFQPAALAYLHDHPGLMTQVPVGGMPPMEAEIAQSLQGMIDEGHAVLAVRTTGYHVDLDKPWQILEANSVVIEAMTTTLTGNIIPGSSQIHEGAELHGRVVLGENCTIGNRVVVQGDLWLGANSRLLNGAMLDGPVVVGRNTLVQNYCQIGGHSSLGSHGHYGHAAEFSGVALDTVYCYHYMEVWGVVGQGVDFGAATVCGNLRFDDSATIWRIKGRPEQPTHAANAAYFGDFSRTGVNAIIMPGRRIGAYSIVGPGVILYDDLPDRQLITVKQELVTRPWGPERYGW
jgi:UDP-N-acetylglucosamine diphosphorylase / glucose-1-phosphate thymidylyltransferase / UDP-N-acetylgalactosamine diphosphorylase / glucosamine-1-phosphate N-acetyltransferase / galactosamine-1-phosphate N-acetyltransferase